MSTVDQKVLGEKPIVGVNHCVEHIKMEDSSAPSNSNSSMSVATHLKNVVALIEKGVVTNESASEVISALIDPLFNEEDFKNSPAENGGAPTVLTNDDFVGRVVSNKGRYPEVTCKVQMGNQMLTTRLYGTSPLWTKDLSKEGAQNGSLLMPDGSRVASDCIHDVDYLLMAEYADTITLHMDLNASIIVEEPDENNGSRITSSSWEWSHQWIVNYGKVGWASTSSRA
ncbi:hypothetical protein SUGI_0774520 [Cryptomeria japonica]|nr:hypothetical protein SUGI_0774520 [Cryptomeria japonica]